MAAGHSFQVQWSINDTPLTRALELGYYSTAETLIEENVSDPSYMNEGPYERVPLYIVLCGQNQDGTPRARNLHIARLLVQHGADTNKRVPMYEMGVVVYSIESSRSPMELLILFFIQCLKMNLEDESKDIPSVIGFNKRTHLSFQELQAELLELVDLFIAQDSEVNLWYDTHYPMINYLLQTSPDADLMQKLCEAGADLNAIDAHGNTALLALCQPVYCEPESRKWLRANNQKEVLHYLLSWKDIKINAVNCQNQSALWLCLNSHWWDMVKMLLNAGADLSVGAMVYIPAFPEDLQPDLAVAESVPAVFAAAIGTATQQNVNSKGSRDGIEALSCLNEFKVPSQLATMTDAGLLNEKVEVVENSIISFLPWMKSFSMHKPLLDFLHRKEFIIPHSFGQLSVSLKQLCIRTIMYKCLQNMHSLNDHHQSCSENLGESSTHANDDSEVRQVKKPCKTLPSSKDMVYKKEHGVGNNKRNLKWLFCISHNELQKLLKQLGLPTSFVPYFEFELYRCKLMIVLKNSEKDWIPCECSDLDMFIESSDISDGDSEIEEMEEEYSHPFLFGRGEIDCIVTHF